MIVTTKIHHCPNAAASTLYEMAAITPEASHAPKGCPARTGKGKDDQIYHCHTCGAYGTLDPDKVYSQVEKARTRSVRAYQERVSLRGLERTLLGAQHVVFGVARHAVGHPVMDL